jgi:aconitase B
MSVSFIYQNLAFHYRIDSHSSSLPFIAWGCRDIPIHGEAQSKEHMYEQIKQRLKQYYRNRVPVRKACDTCGLTSPKMEAQSTCPSCLTETTTNK